MISTKKIKIVGIITTICLGISLAMLTNLPSKFIEKPPIELTSSALFPEMNLDTLSTEANYIIIGKIQKQLPAKLEKDKNGDMYVYTDYEVKVEKELKNPLINPGQTIILSKLGGSAEGYNMTVYDTAKVDIGERLLLFVHQDKNGRNWIIGGDQGKYSLIDGKALNKDTLKSTTEEDLVNKIKLKLGKQ
ncbi:MAG: hypothetical protein M0021_04325 [Clostridia bacterium]|nr:hypothetical protein [Clostridia bacterium]